MQTNLAPKWVQNTIYAWPPLSPLAGSVLPDVAVYDLEHQPTTFDFVPWCAMARSMGAKSVRFINNDKIQDWKYSTEIATGRLLNILIPVAELFGLEWSIGDRCTGFTVGHHYGHVVKYHQHHGVKLLDADGDPDGHVTVTIRDSIRNKFRDSDRREWNKVISWLENHGERVVVIEDGEASNTVMGVDNRFKLYSAAKMNLGVSNGPMSLCHFSRIPYLMFKMIPECSDPVDMMLASEMRAQLIRGGFPPESQLPFRASQQELVWKMDTFDHITRAYGRIIEQRNAVAV